MIEVAGLLMVFFWPPVDLQMLVERWTTLA